MPPEQVSELDILNSLQNVDLSKIETSFPLLKTGNVLAQISKMEFASKGKKEDENDQYINCKLEYTLQQPWETVPIDGAPSKAVSPGFKFTENIYCSPWTDPETKEVKNFGLQRLTLLRECIYGKAPPGTALKKEDFLGRTVMVKLKFEPAPVDKKTKQVMGPQTKVDGYVRKAKT
jgi:hypothetical protein